MIKIIKENLDRRYNALLHQKKEGNFLLLKIDYIEFIGKNELLGIAMKSLIKEQKISNKFLQDFFNHFMITILLRQYEADKQNKEKIIFPSFVDKKIEERYNLFKNFRQMIVDEDKAYQEAKETTNGRKVSEATDFFDLKPSKIIKKDDDLFHIQQLHNNLMEKLSEIEIKDLNNMLNKKIGGKNISFKDGILYFLNKEFDFNNKPIQKDLLNTLFKKPKYQWTNDEIWEDWGENDLKTKTLKFYTASDEINKTITLDTGIRDFLIKSTKQIQINPKYLG